MSDVDLLVKVRDACTLIADACQEKLEKMAPKGTQQDVPPDLAMVIWKPTTGPKGVFEIAESKTNANNAAFDRLNSYLEAHNGKAQVSGYFLWKFGDSSGSIGRKLVQKQP
jgi:hypothetical protein